jgi:hypothetical protein
LPYAFSGKFHQADQHRFGREHFLSRIHASRVELAVSHGSAYLFKWMRILNLTAENGWLLIAGGLYF